MGARALRSCGAMASSLHHRAPVAPLDGWSWQSANPAAPPTEASLRRLVNVAAAAFGLVLAAPVMAAIAVLIKLTSQGPVLYSQIRVGLDLRRQETAGGNGRRQLDCGGRPFTIHKFRTMEACSAEDQVWAKPEDPRVTRLGRILRQYRLDELPQLVNVLRGDMNLVGPRPEQPRIFAELRERIPGYQWRQWVRPGITGWAQVNHHYDSCIDDVERKVALDLEYVMRQSPLEDLRIMLRTIPVVLFKRGGW